LLSCQGIWIDGTDEASQFNDPAVLAYLFPYFIPRQDVDGGTYYDIDDWDIFFNTAASGHPNWCYSATCPQDPDVFDFQGVVTHELGHAIHLGDLTAAQCNYGPGMYTMCGSVTNGWPDTTRYRSITNDDIAGANATY
jgi:hypothetical protein